MKKRILPCLLIMWAWALPSCNPSPENSGEKAEIQTMDSTTTVVKQQNDKLEDQTKKVEDLLEKLDQDSETSNR